MRALVMDFPADRKALDVADEFMYGPALLVNPVTNGGATSRSVYLPSDTNWFDFWTGAPQKGGQTITATAPLETIPLFVRAGSILPMGPELQYSTEKPADPLELRIYRGANGQFTLYEDDGESYDYEKGAYATIAFTWNDLSNTVSIGTRTGSFPGLLKQRTFRIVLVAAGHGVGGGPTSTPEKLVTYDGTAQTLHLAPR